jgi:hypothetical protein
MVENNAPPRRSQPFLDILNRLKREPLGPKQQAELAKLRAHLRQDTPDLDRLREMLSMSPEEAEQWKQRWKGLPSASLLDEIQRAFEQWQLQQEVANAPAPATTPEPTSEPAAANTTATGPTNSPADEAANEDATETADDQQSSSPRKPGPRRIEWPHLREALEALGEKWPGITEVESKHINFVIKHLRQKGDDLAYELTEAGDKDERQQRTVRRRIEEWLETRKGNLSR